MIIDKNGRLFGKVSIVDIFVIILAVVIAVGVYVRFSGDNGKAVVSNDTFYYTFEVQNVRRFSYDAVMKSRDLHYYSIEKSEDDMGVLVDVEAQQGTLMIEKSDGTAVKADVTGNYNMELTFKIDGKINDKGFYTSSMRGISAGGRYTIKSKYSTIEGIVSKVWKE